MVAYQLLFSMLRFRVSNVNILQEYIYIYDYKKPLSLKRAQTKEITHRLNTHKSCKTNLSQYLTTKVFLFANFDNKHTLKEIEFDLQSRCRFIPSSLEVLNMF
jgi:hypothetical protein